MQLLLSQCASTVSPPLSLFCLDPDVYQLPADGHMLCCAPTGSCREKHCDTRHMFAPSPLDLAFLQGKDHVQVLSLSHLAWCRHIVGPRHWMIEVVNDQMDGVSQPS